MNRRRLHSPAIAILLVSTAVAGLGVRGTLASQGTSDARPPAVGEKARDFSLATIDGTTVALSAELARGPVVLIVGRGWVGYQCPFCTRQFGDFLRHAGALESAGARVIWIYPGPADQIQQRAREAMSGQPIPSNFRVLLDSGYGFAAAYGLRWDAPNETAYPSTFVIDRTGVIRFALVSRTHDGRATAAQALEVLAAIAK
jgi:peroxiredoxin